MSANLLDDILKQFSPATVSQVGERAGASPSQTSQVISAALPLLLGALAKNATKPGGAEALSQAIDRDGHGASGAETILQQHLAGALPQNDRMVSHMLGDKRPAIEQTLAAKTGLPQQSIAQILQTLGPLVLGAIGKQKQSQGLDPGALAGYLNQQKQSAKNQAGDIGSQLFDMLDANDDGSVMDDVMRLAGQFMGSKPGR